MTFEYNPQQVFTKQLDIVDIGDTAICCRTAKGFEYYIVTKSVMGKIQILTFGPILPDIAAFTQDFNCHIKVIDFKQTAIQREIKSVLNNPKAPIIQAEQLPPWQALSRLPNIVECFQNF